MSEFKTANLYSTVALRTTTDEALPSVFTTLGYKPSFTLVDSRIAFGYLGVAVAAATFLVEKKFKFEEGLGYTKILLALYIVISTLGWFHSKFIEKDIIYKGSKKDHTVELSGTIDKYVPNYNLTLRITSKDQAPTEVKTVLEFKNIFDKFGNLHEGELASWLKKQLEFIQSKKQ